MESVCSVGRAAVRGRSWAVRLRVRLALGLALIGSMGLLASTPDPAEAYSTTRISVSSAGAQGNNFSHGAAVSPNGRYVAFVSAASNLVPGDTNGTLDVFVHDRNTGITERVNVATGGEQANDFCENPAISADGRYAAFACLASNLVPGDTNAKFDIFVRDRDTGTTERVSVATGGAQADDGSCWTQISADGRYVAFESSATNLVPGDTYGKPDVFVHDRDTGVTERVSVSSAGAQAEGDSIRSAISADGRYVAFSSSAANLVPGDTNARFDIFIHDRDTGTTERVSVATGGAQANDSSSDPAISVDGRHVAFRSEATNLVPGDTNGRIDVFVRDLETGITERVSVSTGGAEANGRSCRPAISADGGHVVFMSEATNLAPGDTNSKTDVFVRDLATGITERASIAGSGTEANAECCVPLISADGRYVFFQSDAANLVTGDTNGRTDVFVRERPVADFSAAPSAGLAPLAVSFADFSTGGPIAWTWAFGDGVVLSAPNPTHVYAAPGVYTVQLTVTDGAGWSRITKADYIAVGASVTADFSGAPTLGVVPLTVTFTNLSTHTPSDPITAQYWDFGDGGASTEETPTHTYAAVGVYSVSLTAENDRGSDTETKTGYVKVAFTDTPTDFWATDYILACVNAGIVGGFGDLYRPTLAVTRDAMAVFISRALAGGDSLVPTGPPTATFSDVPTSHWAYRYVEYAVDNGVVGGFGSLYRPTLTVTRDSMAVFVARAMAGGDASVPTGPPTAFFTDTPTDHWAFRYVEYCHDEGVVGGYADGTYRPLLAVDRASMAVYVQRAFALPM
jgi:PKD repeat protein/Tol biopolymer transport system component